MGGSCIEGSFDDDEIIRRGPWTLEEDNLLIHYITCHGEGQWNSLAKSSGLKRSGKSCRLRWLNYLKPDIKRGNLTHQEQLLILELHSKWGNRWSKIACQLPGRTDNEIKNYWRTRVQKQARHLKIDANSKMFVETLRRFWMPRLLEKVELQNSSSPFSTSTSTAIKANDQNNLSLPSRQAEQTLMPSSSSSSSSRQVVEIFEKYSNLNSNIFSSESMAMFENSHDIQTNNNDEYCYHVDSNSFDMQLAMGPGDMSLALEVQMSDDARGWMKNDGDLDSILWKLDEVWH